MNLRFWTRKFWSDMGYGLGSGPYLVRKLVRIADIENVDIIIEFGAGYGQVTQELIAKKSPHTRLIVIENDPIRIAELRKKYSTECEIYEMSVAHVNDIIGIDSVDRIISTLPLGSISLEGVDHIIQAAHSILKKGGKFIQYQYALQNLKDVSRYFVVDSIRFEPRNIWPAFIYQTHKK